MTIKQQGEALWGQNSLTYTCGCTQIAGKSVCPIHGKGIKEQMIYGNDSNVKNLNEKEKYQEHNLNEGK